MAVTLCCNPLLEQHNDRWWGWSSFLNERVGWILSLRLFFRGKCFHKIFEPINSHHEA